MMTNSPGLFREGSDVELVYKLVKQAPVGITLMMGPDFIVEIANDSALALWGKQFQDVYKLPASKAFPELEQQGLVNILHTVYSTGKTFIDREAPIALLRNGKTETRFIDFIYEPLRSEEKILGVVCIADDVSESAAARKRVEESEKRSFELLAQAAVGITVYQGEELVVVLANASALEIWGKSLEDVLGKPVLQISPELKDTAAYHAVLQVLKTGVAFQGKEIPIGFVRNGENQTGYFDVVYTAWKGVQGEIKGVITVYTEVTHSVIARKKVEEKEAQLRIALEGGDLGYFDFYPQTGELTWSERIRHLFGVPADTPASLELFSQILHPDDRAMAQQRVNEAMDPAGNRSYDNEYRVIGPVDGKMRWLRSRGKTTFDDTGKPVRFAGVVQDITKEKRAEEIILQSEERFRSTFENAAVGIAHVGLDGSWLMTNARLSEIIGYTKEELIGKTFQDITHPDDLQKDLDLLQLLLEGHITNYSMQKRYIRRDGDIVWINLTVALARDNQGKPVYFISVIQDISDQKKAEDAVRQSEEQFRTLADNFQNLAWMADDEGRIFWYNKRWYAYTGTSPGEMERLGWQKFLHRAHAEKVLEFISQAWMKGEPYELTFPLRRHDSEFRWFLTRVFPIKNDEGEVVCWVGTSTDIDEQKTIEDRLELLVKEKTRELQRSNEDLQQFAHVASHDLKEPVRKVITFGNRLKDEYEAELPPKAKTYINKMEGAARRMYSMINGVLLYSSLNAMRQAMEPVHLTDMIRNIEADLEVPIHQKGAIIEYESLPEIIGSPVLIYQLFYNLLNNCIKFSKEEVSPLISIKSSDATTTEIVRNNLDPARSYFKITVQDNGIGFDQSEAEKIFQTFMRLNSKDQYEGTGLGLALCKKIVERHNGAIYADGSEGQGAVFTVLLPK